jgi:hypothetical protein
MTFDRRRSELEARSLRRLDLPRVYHENQIAELDAHNFHPLASPVWPVCFGLWASTGISGAVSGSIRAASSTRSASIPPTRATSIAPIFPPTCNPLERTISMNVNKFSFGTGTVSESASKSSLRLPKILTD